MNTGAVPGPVRRFLAGLADLRAGEAADMEQVGRLLAELAADEDFFGPLIAQMPAGEPGVHRPAQPERGRRLVLVHRPEGVMAYARPGARSGNAPAVGRGPPPRRPCRTGLADECALRPGDVATLVPPDDVHNHGHVPGSGPSPYSLILLCDTC